MSNEEDQLTPEIFLSVRARQLISHKEKNEYFEQISQILKLGGVVFVYNLVGDNLGKESVQYNTPEKREKFILQRLRSLFSDYDIVPFTADNINFANNSHPLISSNCNSMFIISSTALRNHASCERVVIESVYEKLLAQARNNWTIIGDETGSFQEFRGREASDKITSTMLWMVIPPNSSLPQLPPFFHGTNPDSDALISALESIDRNEEIMTYSFKYEQGKVTQGVGRIANYPHLSMWTETLPLVLEKLASQIDDNATIDIFCERVGTLEPGISIFETAILDLKTALNSRQSWEKLKFNKMQVLAKNPCEHPWMGYPDAIGHVINERKIIALGREDLQHSLIGRIHKSPFRQKSLNGTINVLLKDSSRPLRFLQSLHSIDANDLAEYVRPYMGGAIKDALNSLNADDWQDLLEHIDTYSRDKKGQRATALIHGFIETDKVLSNLDGYESTQFDLLRMMLGTSNHRGAMAEGIRCKHKAEQMLGDGFSPTHDKLLKFQNLLPGLKDNMFDFDVDISSIPRYSNSISKGEMHKLGTIAQTLGLIGGEENLELAIEIERNLVRHGDDRRHIRRHSVLLSELLIEQKEYQSAIGILDKLSYDSQDSFWFATRIKCIALSQQNLSIEKNIISDMINTLDDDHPSQRIAYWYTRWSLDNASPDKELENICVNHLCNLTEVPLFSHDAPGVILACELLDLSSRGVDLSIDATEFYTLVRANSQPSTLNWLKANEPNQIDWLAPLNFNYR